MDNQEVMMRVVSVLNTMERISPIGSESVKNLAACMEVLDAIRKGWDPNQADKGGEA